MIDEYGEAIYRDFAFYYPGLDTWGRMRRGAIDPSAILALLRGLPDGSMFGAYCADADNFRDYLGADKHYEVSAAIHDAIMTNSDITYGVAGGKKKLGLPRWPRPRDVIKERVEQEKKNSVRGFYAMLSASQSEG